MVEIVTARISDKELITRCTAFFPEGKVSLPRCWGGRTGVNDVTTVVSRARPEVKHMIRCLNHTMTVLHDQNGVVPVS